MPTRRRRRDLSGLERLASQENGERRRDRGGGRRLVGRGRRAARGGGRPGLGHEARTENISYCRMARRLCIELYAKLYDPLRASGAVVAWYDRFESAERSIHQSRQRLAENRWRP